MRIFFILALGRSGTSFQARLLSRDRRGVVHQEPFPYDLKLLSLRYAGAFDEIVNRMLEARFRQLLPDPGEAEFYGEVNSYLRYEVDWLTRRFDPVLIHLVRDGRDFVRSAYIRKVYTAQESGWPIIPRDDDPFASRWSSMTRFQQLSWYWMRTNEDLASKLDTYVRFEDILADYDHFAKMILKPTGLRISRDTWRREVRRPRNTSRSYKLRQQLRRWLYRDRSPRNRELPAWRNWDDALTHQFWEICGETMARFGYGRGDAASPVGSAGKGASFPRR